MFSGGCAHGNTIKHLPGIRSLCCHVDPDFVPGHKALFTVGKGRAGKSEVKIGLDLEAIDYCEFCKSKVTFYTGDLRVAHLCNRVFYFTDK